MKRGAAPQKSRRMVRARVRVLGWLIAVGLVLAGLGPLYAWLALNYSGNLTLAQKVSAVDVVRGFDFGPVFLEEGVPGRYFVSAVLPEVSGDYWHTTFEVLDATLKPVYRQDEMRIIGDFEFTPGKRERHVKSFTLDKETGYYYFRYTAVNGVYDANQSAPPVVEFAIRQNVITGAAFWGPAVASLALGLLLLFLAGALLRALGNAPATVAAPVVTGPAAGADVPFARRQWRRNQARPN